MTSTLDKIRRAAAPHGLNLVAATPVARYDDRGQGNFARVGDRSDRAFDRRDRQRRRRAVGRAEIPRGEKSRMVESRESARRLHPRSGRARHRHPDPRLGPAMHHRLPIHEQRPHAQLHRARQSRGHRRPKHPRRHGASCIWTVDRVSRRTPARRRTRFAGRRARLRPMSHMHRAHLHPRLPGRAQ